MSKSFAIGRRNAAIAVAVIGYAAFLLVASSLTQHALTIAIEFLRVIFFQRALLLLCNVFVNCASTRYPRANRRTCQGGTLEVRHVLFILLVRGLRGFLLFVDQLVHALSNILRDFFIKAILSLQLRFLLLAPLQCSLKLFILLGSLTLLLFQSFPSIFIRSRFLLYFPLPLHVVDDLLRFE